MTAQDRPPPAPGTRPATSRSGFTGPNFFIVGAPKCGTTAWATYLSDHPDIFVPKAKEPHFFNTDHPGYRWARSEPEYLSHYKDCKDEKVVSDASVQYLCSEVAARNIAAFNPDARILIMLRRPSAFVRSYHNQLLMNFDETLENLRMAWSLSGQRPDDMIPPQNREASFLNYKRIGLFSEQIARYAQCFDHSKITITFMEDWSDDPRALYLDLMEFLGINDDGRSEFHKVHGAKHVSSRTVLRMTQRPPGALKMISRAIRRIPGLRGIKPAHVIRKLNKREGYALAEYDVGLAREIDAYFAEDLHRLRQSLTKVGRKCYQPF
jgi:pterin-4a-carbinolamine dehydratase